MLFGAHSWESKLSTLVSKAMKGTEETWERCLNQEKQIVVSNQNPHTHLDYVLMNLQKHVMHWMHNQVMNLDFKVAHPLSRTILLLELHYEEKVSLI